MLWLFYIHFIIMIKTILFLLLTQEKLNYLFFPYNKTRA